jgi:hypothetical protein
MDVPSKTSSNKKIRRRLRAMFCAAAAALAAHSTTPSAGPLLYEGFNYPVGPLIGQTNSSTGHDWLQAGTQSAPSAINVNAGSLTPPPSLQPAVGNALAIVGIGNATGASERLAWTGALTSGTAYCSLSLRVNSILGSNNTTGGFFTGFNNTSNVATTTNPTIVAARLQARIDPSDASRYDLGIFANVSATATASSWSGALGLGETHFIVAAYDFNPGTDDDLMSLWIDPDPSTFGTSTPPAATVTATGGDVGQLASIIVRQSPAPQLTMDEVRVGTGWADVTSVPEPSAALGLGAASLLLAARRTRQGIINGTAQSCPV